MCKMKGNELSNINDFVLRMIDINDVNDRKAIIGYIMDLVENQNENHNVKIKMNNNNVVPDCYCDPISYEIMNDPVLITVSGHTYEREFIKQYIEQNKKDPITQQSVELKDIVANRALKDSIDIWKRQNS